MKPYKACAPEQTVSKIKEILNRLDLSLLEKRTECEGLFNFSRVTLNSDNLEICNIGTNGKGKSDAYSLASAYGEFMERLQNNILFDSLPLSFAVKNGFKRYMSCKELQDYLVANDATLPFWYAPEEKEATYTPKETRELFRKLFPTSITPDKGLDKLNQPLYPAVLLPFYEVFSDSVQWLPYDWMYQMTGSNGMSAGNTKEEALVQGLNEIIERYVIRQLYLNRITPPDLNNTMFEGTEVLKRLEKLRSEYGIDYYIKDCSLGKNFPVVGLLLIDRADDKYIFHIGVDVSPIIALERCYTEIFQGYDEAIFQKIDLYSEIDFKEECNKTIRIGRGRWYRELFYDEPTYGVCQHFYESSSEKDDLNVIVHIIKSFCSSIFVRDVSYLGFPAFYIYVPGMSDVNYQFRDDSLFLNIYAENYDVVPPQYDLNSCDEERLRYFSDRVKECCGDNIVNKRISFFPYVYDCNNELPVLLILAGNYLKLKNYGESLTYLKKYLENAEKENVTVDSRLYGVCNYLYFKELGYDLQRIDSILSLAYGEKRAQNLIELCETGNAIIDGTTLPQCFHCNLCVLKDSCRFLNVVKTVKRLNMIQMDNPIEQQCLRQIFWN